MRERIGIGPHQQRLELLGEYAPLLGRSQAPVARHGKLGHMDKIELGQNLGFDQGRDFRRVGGLAPLVLTELVDYIAGNGPQQRVRCEVLRKRSRRSQCQ